MDFMIVHVLLTSCIAQQYCKDSATPDRLLTYLIIKFDGQPFKAKSSGLVTSL